MTAKAPLVFKVASEPWELELIHHLNYRTFVEEIPQHAPNAATRLVDKFDAENTYLICLRGRDLLGMIAVRGQRPFSLDAKLADLDAYLPPHHRLCEFRLLSVTQEHRNGRILLGLMDLLNDHCTEHGYDLAVISGTTRQQRLYRHLGFVPFGPLVGAADAAFQPMYLTLEHAEKQAKPLLRLLPSPVPPPPATPVNLLPGPVGIPADVRAAYAEAPVSHRSEAFVEALRGIRRRLGALVHASHVAVMTGSGTLANDVIAAQLSLLPGPGLVLANGEFGERLIDHATRFGLAFKALRLDWGAVFDRAAIERALDRLPSAGWLWAVHCETSTGVLNDLATLKAVAVERELRLCLDCISSIGTVPVDLAGIRLASGVSGKGLAALPGLALVFAAEPVPPAPTRLPRSLDLGLYLRGDGVPFTLPSNPVAALDRALDRAERPERFAALAALAAWLRGELEALGFRLVAPAAHASPAVLTLALPPAWSSDRLGAALRDAGYLLSYQSGYLLNRNWLQICLMGEHDQASLAPLLVLLRDANRHARGA